MMENNSQCTVTRLGNNTLHIIDDKIMDNEALMHALTTHYQSQPGYKFLCRVYSRFDWGEDIYNFCWWVITDEVAIRYRCRGYEESLFYWASQPEAQNIWDIVEQHGMFSF